MIFGDKNLKEIDAFELIDDLQRKNIPLLIDSKTGKLNLKGRQQLKSMVEDFMNNKSNKIQSIQNEIKELKEIVEGEIEKIYDNIEKFENIEQNAK